MPPTSFALRVLLAAGLCAALGACGFGAGPEVPGDQPNPMLAAMASEHLDGALRRLDPRWVAQLQPGAQAQAQQWLGEIAEVVARCRYGPGDRSRGNLMEYDITLASGEVLRDVQGFRRCSYDLRPPLVMRVRFRDGRVDAVLTDGRERRFPPDDARNDLNTLVDAILRADQTRRPALYFPPGMTQADLDRLWTPR